MLTTDENSCTQSGRNLESSVARTSITEIFSIHSDISEFVLDVDSGNIEDWSMEDSIAAGYEDISLSSDDEKQLLPDLSLSLEVV